MNPRLLRQVQRCLDSFGLTSDERYDDMYTAALARELEYIETTIYRIKYPEFKWASIVPIKSDIPEGAKTWTYQQWDMFGAAEIIANAADDLPLVDAMKEEFTSVIQEFGDAYMVTLSDLEGSAFSGIPIENERAMAARFAVDNRYDIIVATGAIEGGLRGILDLPNVPFVTPVNGAWDTATVATGPEMIEDLTTLVDTTIETNRETFFPNTILLDDINYRFIQSTPYSQYTEKSTLKVFLESNEYIDEVISYQRARTADLLGTGPRAVCYKRDPLVLQHGVPMQFRQLPPQARNLAFIINCRAKSAGVRCRYPLAMSYMDGL